MPFNLQMQHLHLQIYNLSCASNFPLVGTTAPKMVIQEERYALERSNLTPVETAFRAAMRRFAVTAYRPTRE
jgi:hypothetical protein